MVFELICIWPSTGILKLSFSPFCYAGSRWGFQRTVSKRFAYCRRVAHILERGSEAAFAGTGAVLT